jgi:glycosyltransferase involved in cell wall biosynthesis
MNICSIAYSFYEVDLRVRRYAELLVNDTNRVDAIMLKRHDQPYKGIVNGVNVYRIQKRAFDEKFIFNYVFKILSFFIKGSIILLFKHIRYRYKVIHIHNVPDFLVFMAIIPKLMGAKIILDIHDIMPEFFCQKFNKSVNTLSVKFLLFVERMSVSFADHIVVSNDIWRNKIIDRDKVLPEKCTTILNYADLSFFDKELTVVSKDKDRFNIIYPGTISHLHGLDILIKAMSIVHQKLPHIKVDVYAATTNRYFTEEINKLISSLNLDQIFKFHDPVTIEELAKVYKDFDLGVIPKRGGIFAEEAFSTKTFDYMAAGLPIVASKTKIDQYYFDDSIIMFFEPENYEELAKCIIALYHDPEKRQDLMACGKKFVETNNWECKKCIYLKIIDNLVRSKDQ